MERSSNISSYLTEARIQAVMTGVAIGWFVGATKAFHMSTTQEQALISIAPMLIPAFFGAELPSIKEGIDSLIQRFTSRGRNRLRLIEQTDNPHDSNVIYIQEYLNKKNGPNFPSA